MAFPSALRSIQIGTGPAVNGVSVGRVRLRVDLAADSKYLHIYNDTAFNANGEATDIDPALGEEASSFWSNQRLFLAGGDYYDGYFTTEADPACL